MDKRDFQEVQQKFAAETKKKKINKILNLITVSISIIGAIVIGYYFINALRLDRNIKNSTELNFRKIQLQNETLKNELRVLKSNQKTQIIDSALTNDINVIGLRTLEGKIESLELLIMDSPEKALTIPLLAKEIENQKTINESKIELLQDKIETVTDLNKWILGLIFSLLISIVISNLFGYKKQKEDKSVEK